MANREELSHNILDFAMETYIKVNQKVSVSGTKGVSIIGKHFIQFLKLLVLFWRRVH